MAFCDQNNLIKDGDQVIIKTNKVLKVFQVKKSRKIRVEKLKFTLDGAIGHTFGTTFEVKEGKLLKVDTNQEEDLAADIEIDRDNRNLKDTTDNQKLKKEDIHALKKEGATGKEIIEHLVENSATFKDKTDYAQEKYIKKKKKKHVSLFTILQPNTRLLAQMYFSRGSTKICNLRYDSIAQILTYANVRAGCKLMVCESITGLLVGAVLERLASHGTLIQLYTGSAPSREALEAFQFPHEIRKTLLSFPLIEISSVNRQNCPCATEKSKSLHKQLQNSEQKSENETEIGERSENVTDNGDEKCEKVTDSIQNSDVCESTIDDQKDTEAPNVDSKVVDGSSKDSKVAGGSSNDSKGCDIKEDECSMASDEENKEENMEDDSVGEDSNKRKTDWDAVKDYRRKQRTVEHAQSRELLESGSMDGLIICTKYNPTPIAMSLIEFVAPSRPVVIFSQHKEPLLDCYIKLRDRGGVINLKLTETWLRNYQVLSNRTHPEINMSGSGGYLLTGTTVLIDS